MPFNKLSTFLKFQGFRSPDVSNTHQAKYDNAATACDRNREGHTQLTHTEHQLDSVIIHALLSVKRHARARVRNYELRQGIDSTPHAIEAGLRIGAAPASVSICIQARKLHCVCFVPIATSATSLNVYLFVQRHAFFENFVCRLWAIGELRSYVTVADAASYGTAPGST